MDTGSLTSEGQLVHFKAVATGQTLPPAQALKCASGTVKLGCAPCLSEADNRAASAPSS